MAGADQYDYIDEGSISERLKCAICSNPFVEPLKNTCTPREHAFCQQCIQDWLQRERSCPTCRQRLNIEDLTPMTERIILDMLDELPVRCPFCQQNGLERGTLGRHIRETMS